MSKKKKLFDLKIFFKPQLTCVPLTLSEKIGSETMSSSTKTHTSVLFRVHLGKDPCKFSN